MARTSEPRESMDVGRRELNPLLNPLLAENMGRWAEVYFTNPPERRDEAVLELLQELERAQSESQAATEASTTPDSTSTANFPRAAQTLSEQRPVERRFCGSCGQENPAGHQFCGMCGAKIHPDASRQVAYEDTVPVNGQVPQNAFADIEPGTGADGIPEDRGGTESYAEPEQERPAPVFNSPAAGSDSLSLFQSFRSARAEDDDWDYEPPQSNYRLYVAAVLLVIIGGLGYMAWRSSKSAQTAHDASPPPPAPVTETAQPAVAPSQAPGRPQETSSPRATRTVAPGPKAENPASSRTELSKAQVAKKTAPARVNQANETKPTSSPAETGPARTTGGAEELAMAQRYLNGSGGQARDGSEAAQWLWKSVAKHNGQAILLLADLYLRGDGVAKNCEQGRVLLDSAAQSGVAGAGERLRNLQAFGCH